MRLTALVRDTAVFAPCYLLLDWASYLDPLGPFNITPWNPQAALAIAWMVLGGLANAPWVAATVFLADLVVRDAPAGLALAGASGVALAAVYAAIAYALRRSLPGIGLRSTREVTTLSVLTLAGSCAASAVFIGLLAGAGLLQRVEFVEAWLRFWIGDAVGILVTLPLLFAAADHERRAGLRALLRKPEAWLQAAVVAGVVALLFRGFGADPARHFYVLFLPLIWIAVRQGLNGAVVGIAIAQMAVVLGIHGAPDLPLPVPELQAMIAALTLTGLYLGVMVDQRQRAEQGLRESLRLAAAGEMAGAIAHEVNQPLTAVTNYSRAARMVLEKEAPDAAQAREIVGRIAAEADRAAEIVRRLRDFFRAGTTRLAPLSPDALQEMLRRLGARATEGRGIAFALEAAPDLPALFADALQLEVVLRNLVDNAAESLAGAGVPKGRIDVALTREGDRLRVRVRDNGPGLSREAQAAVFEPFVSGKSTGMGLGLAVSRAIAEAHGGTLAATGSGGGEFVLELPGHRP